jgi:hypothetical protein
MVFSLILNLPIKRPSVQKTLHFSAIRLVCSYRPTNRQYMAIYGLSWDVILEFDIQNLRLVILYVLLGISVIMVAHARF